MQKQTKEQYHVLQQLMEKQLAEQSRVYEHLLSEKDKIISELKEEIESHKKINYNESLFLPKEQLVGRPASSIVPQNIKIGISCYKLVSISI